MNISKTFLATSCMLPLALHAHAAKDKAPNVLLFIVDDLGSRDLTYMGSDFYETPHIDKLADKSTTFSQAYVAYPRSVPSRYSIITGRHCARPQAGAKSDDRKVDKESYCIAMPFQEAGYNTFIVGKWHLSDGVTTPEDKGFNVNIGAGKAGATSSYFAPFNVSKKTGKESPLTGMDDAKPGEYLTDYMSRKTADFILENKNKPFFAICSYYAVHTPLQAPKERTAYYQEKVLKMQLGKDPMKQEEAGDSKTQQDHPTYAAMVESVDNGVGEIIAALKKSGAYENTIIAFVSDHGGLSNRGNKRELATTNAPLKAGKGHLYEGGIRVPMFIHLPKQNRNVEIDVPVVSYDLVPTLTKLCNLEVDQKAEVDGVDLTQLMEKKQDTGIDRRTLFWHKASERPTSTGDYVATAMRRGDMKLIDFYAQNRIELYDLAEDPSESENIAARNPEIVQEMLTDMNQWRNEFQVKMTPDRKDDASKPKGKGKGKGKAKKKKK